MTMRRLAALTLLAGLGAFATGPLTGQSPAPMAVPESKYPDFATFVKGAKVIDGVFTMHLKDDHLYAEIQPFQFDRPYMFAAAVAKGAGMGGTTLIGDEAWVLYFKKVGEKVFLMRKNTRFRATPGTPAAKATETTYSDSVLMALPIRAMNPFKGSVLVDFNQVFFTDFAETNLGSLDSSRTTWGKVKGFKKNIELQVAATFTGNRRSGHFGPGRDDVIDNRGLSVVLHYSLIELPDPGYTARHADDRVGHFISVVKDFNAAETKDTPFVRYVNRWRLDRADNSQWKEGGKLAAPKKKIVFWIENSVPDEYRAAVREGILEWNKAFEKIGFRDAIEVRQQEGEDFDPEDITYATFRWVTNEQSFAIGPSRVNPITGEIIDADILFDASMVRFNKAEYRMMRNERGEPDPGGSPRVDDSDRPLRELQGTAEGRSVERTLERTHAGNRTSPETARAAARILPVFDAQIGRTRSGRTARDVGFQRRRQSARRTVAASDQGNRDARGRAHARLPAQLQGQHDAAQRQTSRHDDHA